MALENIIKQKLQDRFSPLELEVENESHKHAGHAGSPGTGESHFRVYIKSDLFEGMSRIQIHREIHDCLSEEMSGGIHALSIQALPK
ncbi:MAG: BolA family protein [Alphaproteobacteria bacterium]